VFQGRRDFKPYIGKFFINPNIVLQGNLLLNIETGEMFHAHIGNTVFTGADFYRVRDTGVVTYNPFVKSHIGENPWGDVLFEPPHGGAITILDSEYVFVKHSTGTYLHRIIEGDTAGELVAEIII
jgi:hypothetical protein